MTIDQIKEDIHKAIENIHEHELPPLLNHIRSIAAKYPTKEELHQFIAKVFKEDDELLRTLADS